MFDINGKLWDFLTKMTDLIFLNILFVLFSLPICTFGASKSALYDQIDNLLKGQNNHIIKNFYLSFKAHFKQSTLAWFLYLILLVIIFLNYYSILQLRGNVLIFTLTMSTTIVFFIISVTFLYTLLINAYFENTYKNNIKNGLILAIANLPRTLVLMVIEWTPLILFFFFTQFFLYIITFYLVIGFSSSALIMILIFRKTHTGLTILNNREEKKDDSFK